MSGFTIRYDALDIAGVRLTLNCPHLPVTGSVMEKCRNRQFSMDAWKREICRRAGVFRPGSALSEAGLALEEPGNDDPFNVMDSVKLIASDMDGTLLNGKGELDPAFFSLFEKLERRGIRFAAASGRQYDGLRRIFAPVADRMLFIAENGAYAASGEEEWLVLDMDPETVARVIGMVRNIEGACIVLAGRDSAYIEDKQPEFVREARRYYTRCREVEDLLDVRGDRLLKIAVYDFRGAKKNSYPRLKHLEHGFQVAVSGEKWMDISRKGADKGSALELIQRKLGVSPEETMVFGDQMNDAEMMRQARFSYAVANAVPEIRAMAAFKAPSNEENGVMQVLGKVLDSHAPHGG